MSLGHLTIETHPGLYIAWLVLVYDNKVILSIELTYPLLSLRWQQSYNMKSAHSFTSDIKRHSEGTFTSDFTEHLDNMKARDFVHWLINAKRYR
uniref:Glucagon / GIP / secretin / VIP family domain-containing protein n=2 Tax=Colubroidea TaxID=34989 RepID=A0A670YQ35_PSETE